MSLAVSWNTLEMCCCLLKRLKCLKLLKLLKCPARKDLSAKPALIRFRNSIAGMPLKLLKRALETLETLDKSCYLLKHSWNVLLSLETLEMLGTLKTLEMGARPHPKLLEARFTGPSWQIPWAQKRTRVLTRSHEPFVLCRSSAMPVLPLHPHRLTVNNSDPSLTTAIHRSIPLSRYLAS